jgi:FHS family L-fucose permease-like MFS transporter
MAGAIETRPATAPTTGATSSNAGAFATVTLLFFFWGFITCMNDVLIPFLKESFQLSYFQSGLVQFAFFGAFFVVSLIYFFISVSSGDPINRVGYQRTIVFSLVVCAAGCALFAPAAGAISYPFFLGALFLLATGVTILQIAANPYAAILGPPENASARLNLAQGFNSLGTTLAPVAGGLLLYKIFATGGEVTLDAIKTPYLIYAGMFLALAILIAFSKLPAIGGSVAESGNALAFPQLRFGMAAIFLYVGAEVAIGSFLVSFMAHESVMGWAEGVASLYLAYYWGGAMIGRLCGATAMSTTIAPQKKPLYMILTAAALLGLIYVATAVRFENGQLHMEFLKPVELIPFSVLIVLCLAAFGLGKGKPGTILAIFGLAIVALLVVSGLATGSVALWAALGAGLFNSIMWSNIFTLAIDDLGEHTSQGSSLLVMMVVGGALFPLLMGAVADNYGIREAFFVPIVSYVYIAWYGWWSQRRLNAKGLAA